MKKELLPVYDIEAFKYPGSEGDFYANTLQDHLRQHSEFVLVPHKHTFYFTAICTKGSGTHDIEFNRYKVHPGTVFMMSPGQVHGWRLSADIEGYVIFHTKAFFDLYFVQDKAERYPFFCCNRNSPLINLKKDVLKSVGEIYNEIVHEFRGRELMKFQKISSLLNVLYIDLTREYIPVTVKNHQNLNYLTQLQKLTQLIDLHFRSIKSPKAYAEMMHMSEKHLNRICKTTINQTVSEIITERIILEAKRLIRFSHHNISEIIDVLGYEDPSYFSRIFKKHTGKTPLAFMHSRKGILVGEVDMAHLHN